MTSPSEPRLDLTKTIPEAVLEHGTDRVTAWNLFVELTQLEWYRLTAYPPAGTLIYLDPGAVWHLVYSSEPFVRYVPGDEPGSMKRQERGLAWLRERGIKFEAS